ncbi:hypothetical protein BCR33DRAFT_713682 [Rhizoclosmatium globosum]|uniref:RNI-like protein n=1 Tax=Rhizoclosmatium globosum TaxID=329046 RepID=A0A1Y2CQR7_9FUNG|nr:hypothetical protein BCR33DRAFT_713682 [Rhizoclosmatium globosum]|eukprot:ORY49313.1 hypothetical protein BCR33DRAFT_713682 [Rhizoclosmatium globosum]
MSDFYDPDFALKDTDTIFRPLPYDPSVAAQSSSGIRPLRELCAEVVAGLIDHVESLNNVPWNLAKEIWDNIKTPSASAVALVCPFNKHLVYRDWKLCDSLRTSIRDGWFAMFLTSLDLSGTDLKDDLCTPISRLECLELLDISSTEITNDGLRNLCRSMVHSDRDGITGLPKCGLKNLAFLNISMCSKLNGADLDVILSRFPSLLIIGLNRTFVQRMGVVTKMKSFGWNELGKRVNAFPGFHGGVSSSALDTESVSLIASNELPPMIPSERIQSVHSNQFFGTLEKAAKVNLKKERDDYFKCRVFRHDEIVSLSSLSTVEPAYRSVIEAAWALTHHVPDHLETRSACKEKLNPFNDLFDVIAGKSKLVKHRTMNPWYLPFNTKDFSFDNKEANDRLVSEIVESEIHGRLTLIRTEARRDMELRKALGPKNILTSAPQNTSQQSPPAEIAKKQSMSKMCQKRLEPAPAVVTIKSNNKKPSSACIPDFGAFLELEKDFGKQPAPLLSSQQMKGAKSSNAKSGLFNLLSKNK